MDLNPFAFLEVVFFKAFLVKHALYFQEAIREERTKDGCRSRIRVQRFLEGDFKVKKSKRYVVVSTGTRGIKSVRKPPYGAFSSGGSWCGLNKRLSFSLSIFPPSTLFAAHFGRNSHAACHCLYLIVCKNSFPDPTCIRHNSPAFSLTHHLSLIRRTGEIKEKITKRRMKT
ncbi:hypothetical protein VTN00DRAFT_551 [Thermoascus crustaceus]|uniref:uncharacterized protein n=1 Tax=Thermoascus crustaceus TaxID=5088 RepID=UPI003743A855